MAIAALITWIITAGFGFYMLGTWLRGGGARGGGPSARSHFRPPVVFGHFGLAAAGLVVWIVYLVTDSSLLAWIAFVDLLVVVTLGDVLVLRWTKDRRTAGAAPVAANAPAATSTGAATTLVEQQIPRTIVIVHGVFAVTTVVLVLLAALGVGGS
ncbi:hypothetical protein GCM10009841_18590 [Microlunatus panaciterrae]|uniref:DUF2269 family protein n=1 Tax=Microlunatus panaciterrae TaxID=400768 RepID=A0ABS2RN65_9ACTN|nr:hypothetical protein [Microlunatus panaciterrae]MBM7800417.1 hypothetical protein [Microlunatus panaciterrae]